MMCEREPIGQLVIVVHPFKPTKGFTLHVKTDHVQPLVDWNLVIMEELVGLKKPINRIGTIKT